MASKLERGGGCKALVAVPQKKKLFFGLPYPLEQLYAHSMSTGSIHAHSSTQQRSTGRTDDSSREREKLVSHRVLLENSIDLYQNSGHRSGLAGKKANPRNKPLIEINPKIQNRKKTRMDQKMSDTYKQMTSI